MKGLILGGGFTGLAAAIKTGWPIYEASDHAGGICSSYWKDGFQFAQGGGHWIFGKGLGLDYIKSLVPVNEYERKAGVYYNHTFPYPIQTIADKDNWCNPGSMRESLGRFGPALSNLFFNPFNDKYTCGLYEDVLDFDKYKTPPPGGVGFVSTFCDPVDGLESLVNKMSEKCTIHYKKKAVKIFRHLRAVEFEDGEVVEYDKLISTIPLDQTLNLSGKTDYKLPYTSVLVINIGAKPSANTPEEHWLYIPFCKSGFYRLGFYSNVNKSKAPEGMVSLSVEMAFRDKDYEDLDIDGICKRVVDELQSWRFIGEVLTIDPTWVKCAYTWLYSEEDRDNNLQWLRDRNILSIGRYGAWKFQGMVQSISDGLGVEA